MARKLPVISEAAAHIKTFTATGGRVVAATHKLPVFIRWMLLSILCQSGEATGKVRSMAVARKLSVISQAATHIKTLTATGGRVVAATCTLPVFIRWALLGILRQSCEATSEVRSMAVARRTSYI